MRKLIQFLNKSGKVALSAMQAVGITAVVGAAGIGAWQYLSGPSDDNTAFNPSQYTSSGEVIYVAGANTGGYTGGAYGQGGAATNNSAMQVSGKTLELLDRQAQAERVAQEMEDNSDAYGGQEAYHMGSSEGLGMGANYVSDANSVTDPTTAMQKSMAGMQDMMNRAQQQLAGTAAEQKNNKNGKTDEGKNGKEGVPALARITPNWGSDGGEIGSPSFVIQDSAKNGGQGNIAGGRVDHGKDANAALSNAQAEAARMLEGARIRGRSSFGNTSGLGKDKEATIAGGRRGRRGQSDLEDIQKRSADAAANRHRSNTEGARAFLAGGTLSGGMIIASDNFKTGEGQGSEDYYSSYEPVRAGIEQAATEKTDEIDLRDVDDESLKNLIIWTAVTALIASFLILMCKNVPPYGWIVAAAATAAVLLLVAAVWAKLDSYVSTWGWTGMARGAAWTAGGMVLMAAAAWTVGLTAAVGNLLGGMAGFLGISVGGAALGSVAVVGGTAAGGAIEGFSNNKKE